MVLAPGVRKINPLEGDAGKIAWVVSARQPHNEHVSLRSASTLIKIDKPSIDAHRPREQATAEAVFNTIHRVIKGQTRVSFPQDDNPANDIHIVVNAGEAIDWRFGVLHYWKIEEEGTEVDTYRYLPLPAPSDASPLVLAVVGLPTTGKSTLARELGNRLDLHVIDIDDGPAYCTYEHPQPLDSQAAITRKEAVMRVRYATLIAAVSANVREGLPVICVATFSRKANQELLAMAVAEAGGRLGVVEVTYDDTPEEVARRVQKRIATNLPGGCRATDHYYADKARFQRFAVNDGPSVLTVLMDGGDQGTESAIQQVLEYIPSL